VVVSIYFFFIPRNFLLFLLENFASLCDREILARANNLYFSLEWKTSECPSQWKKEKLNQFHKRIAMNGEKIN
jgi:hypothetical protein